MVSRDGKLVGQSDGRDDEDESERPTRPAGLPAKADPDGKSADTEENDVRRVGGMVGQQPDVPLLHAQVEQNQTPKRLNRQTPLHLVLIDTGQSE